MLAHVGVGSHYFDDVDKWTEEIFVAALVESLDILLYVWQFHQIYYGLTVLNDLPLDIDPVHIENTGQHTISHQFLVTHHLGTIECRYHLHKQFGSTLEIPNNQFVDPFINFQLIFALPVATFLQKTVTFFDVVFYFVVVVLFQIYRY